MKNFTPGYVQNVENAGRNEIIEKNQGDLRMRKLLLALIFTLPLSCFAASHDPVPAQELWNPNPNFGDVFVHVFMPLCMRCHHSSRLEGNFDVSIYGAVMRFVEPGNLRKSKLYGMVSFGLMPPSSEALQPTDEQIEYLETWILNGALR